MNNQRDKEHCYFMVKCVTFNIITFEPCPAGSAVIVELSSQRSFNYELSDFDAVRPLHPPIAAIMTITPCGLKPASNICHVRKVV